MRRIIFLLLLLAAGYQSQAQSRGNSLLWKIERPGFRTGYLFGTIHLICKEDFFWTPVMARALNASDKVCFELDLSNTEDLKHAAAWFIDSTRTLATYFSAAEFDRIKGYMKTHFSMTVDSSFPMKPMGLVALITQTTACEKSVGYEEFIKGEAGSKADCGLETYAEQMNALMQIPQDSFARYLLEAIDHQQESHKEFRELTRYYKAQDLAGLYKGIIQSQGMSKAEGALLDDRNKKWIGRIETGLRANSTFFAVGAGHLWGDQGVIQLLRKAGFEVTALK